MSGRGTSIAVTTLFASLVALAPAQPALSWDTAEDGGWRSIYIKAGIAGHINEHALIAQDSLDSLGHHVALGMNADLFRSFFFVDVSGAAYHKTNREDDLHPETEIEERLAPSPVQFAGLPDFSYSIYDWIHKNDHKLCPGVPTSADPDQKCHEFKGWLGALNANHFGTQGRELYTHLHLIALELAGRADAMRRLLDPHPLEARIYADFLVEAQLEALYYEGYAQHYIQDRWSMGHMWERWNGSDYASIPKLGRYTFEYSFAVGFFSGLIHGSESIRRDLTFLGVDIGYTVGVLDALCGPEITPSMRPLASCPQSNAVFAVPMQYRAPSGQRINAVGDYHYFDMKEGRIDTFCQSLTMSWETRDYRPILPVFKQKNLMADCVDQGWHDILRGLGDPTWTPARNPGKELGEHLGFGGRDHLECWGNWATNLSMYKSWVEDDVIRVGDFARSIVKAKGFVLASLGIDVLRHAMGSIGARMTLWSIANPNGTELARGLALPRLFSARSGDAYVSAGDPVPDWAMPRGFSDPASTVLPWEDRDRGRDQQTMFGFFNRAHADFWCQNPGRVAALRRWEGDEDDDDDDLARIEACTLLADRFYLGSDPNYQGLRTELREVDFFEAAELGVAPLTPYQSVCQLLGVDTTNDPETLPVHVHAGYVASPGEKTPMGHRTIEAWCRRVPVLDYLWMDSASVRDGHHWRSWDDDDRWDVSALADREGGEIVMPGLNLDAQGGVISLTYLECNTRDCGEGGGQTDLIESYRVSNDRATFTLPADMAVGDYAIRLLPNRGPEPVGHFRLRVIAQPLSAPLVLWVDMFGPLKPGQDAYIEAEVYDPDGWIDLDAAQGAFVDVFSDVLDGFGWVVLDRSMSTGLETAVFWNNTLGVVRNPLSDRLSTCPPPEYLVEAEATDTGLSIDPDDPKPLTGPIHEGETTVLNCDPEPGGGAAPMASAPPGGDLKFTVTWADDNHDGAPGCDELPAGNVKFQAQPAGLDTAPALPGLTWKGVSSNPPERTFESDGAKVDNPHRDDVFQGSITTTDDLPAPPTGAIGATIEVENVAPEVLTVIAKPAALHPNEKVTLVVSVTASDDNYGIDIDRVDVDLRGPLGSTLDKATGAGSAVDRSWTGARSESITAPGEPEFVEIPVTAIDDDNARGMGKGVVRIKNVKPVVSGVGFVWDESGQIGTPDEGIIRACEELRVAAIATDLNEDDLEIEVELTQDGHPPVVVKLARGDGNVFVATIKAPCQGTWTLSYTAVEIHPQDKPDRQTLKSDPKTLTLTVHPALDPCACQECVCFGVADNTSCDDCKTCTVSSSCQGGTCQGVEKQCPQDENPCTESRCDESDGECKPNNLPNGERSCDGDVCTNPDRCVAGTCVPGATNPLCCRRDSDCDDNQQCTLDECDEATGVCSNPPLPNGAICNDNVNCTANDRCFAGVCGGIAITCPSLGNACTVERCDEADGNCRSFPTNENGHCEDGDECTINDFCDEGSCRSGSPSPDCCEVDDDCDDDEECTVDTCNPDTNKCSNDPVAEPAGCDDGDPCTDPDTCDNGVCGGVEISCDQLGNFCSVEECDPADGQCKSFPDNQGEACDDDDECTVDTVCDGTDCGEGTTITCCPDDIQCQPDGLCTGAGDGRCLDGMCMLHFQTLAIPEGGAVYPAQAGAPSDTLPAWLDMQSAEVRYGLPSDEITEEPCDVTGVTVQMRDILPDMGDSSFIDIGIWYFDPDGQGDPGNFGPPLQGATHSLSVSWNDTDDVWEGHLWAYGTPAGAPAATWYIVDGAVPFAIDGDTVTIERSIQDFEGCVPHKLLTQYIDGDGNLVWKMVTQGENGVSLDPNQSPLQCPATF